MLQVSAYLIYSFFLFLILEYEIPDRIRNPDKIPDNDVTTQTCAAKQRYTALRISPAEHLGLALLATDKHTAYLHRHIAIAPKPSPSSRPTTSPSPTPNHSFKP
jgi:hypothetical protein